MLTAVLVLGGPEGFEKFCVKDHPYEKLPGSRHFSGAVQDFEAMGMVCMIIPLCLGVLLAALTPVTCGCPLLLLLLLRPSSGLGGV